MEKKDIKSMDLEELTQELLAMGEKNSAPDRSMAGCMCTLCAASTR